MLETIAIGAGIVVSIGGLIISIRNSNSSNEAIGIFRSNCINTLNTKMEMVEKTLNELKDNDSKLFEKVEEVANDLSYMKGRTNGNSK